MAKIQNVNKKKHFVAISTACIVTLGLFGCGSDSSGSGPNSQKEVCTVTKTGSSVTTKMSVEGASTITVYVFDVDGNMTAQSTTTDYSSYGDDATAKTICNAAANIPGATSSYENGSCTITQTEGLIGTIDEIYDAQNMACDAANEAANPKSSSGNSSSETLSSLTELFQKSCTSANVGYIYTVKSEGDYICAPIDFGIEGVEPEYMWAPLVDDISEMPTCSQSYATSNPQKTYAYASSERKVYTCSIDMETFAWSWSPIGVELDIEGGDEENEAGSSDSKDEDVSSSSGPKEKVVDFEDGIMYTSSYGDRVRTFFNTVDEYTFFDDNEITGDKSGWWFKFDDEEDNGSSMVFLTYEVGYVEGEIDLVYKNWSVVGSGNSAYMAPDPYPYGAIGFNMSPTGNSVNMSDWAGLCITYSATKSIELALKSFGDKNSSWYKLLPSANMNTLDIPFNTTNFVQPEWATNYPTFSGAISSVLAIHFKYSNDEASVSCDVTDSRCPSGSTNTIKIFKLGKYGSCSN